MFLEETAGCSALKEVVCPDASRPFSRWSLLWNNDGVHVLYITLLFKGLLRVLLAGQRMLDDGCWPSSLRRNLCSLTYIQQQLAAAALLHEYGCKDRRWGIQIQTESIEDSRGSYTWKYAASLGSSSLPSSQRVRLTLTFNIHIFTPEVRPLNTQRNTKPPWDNSPTNIATSWRFGLYNRWWVILLVDLKIRTKASSNRPFLFFFF